MGAPIVKAKKDLENEMAASVGKALKLPDLDIYYDPVSDTLSLWNGNPAGYGDMVAKHLTADSNAEGEVVGITLENAAELLRPYLYPESDFQREKGTTKKKG